MKYTKQQQITMGGNFYEAYIVWWLKYEDIARFFGVQVDLVKKCINLYIKSIEWTSKVQ